MEAAALTRDAMLAAVSEPAEYALSGEFEHKIEALRSEQKRKEQRRAIRKRLAAAVIALFMTGSMVLALNTQVRAEVFTWVKQVYETHTMYWFGMEKQDTLPHFELTYIPEGFTVLKDESTSSSRTVIYEKGEEYFGFIYHLIQEGSQLLIDYRDAEYSTIEIKVNDCEGHFYWSDDPTESKNLVWIDEVNGVIFIISAYFEQDVILHIAESAKLVN